MFVHKKYHWYDESCNGIFPQFGHLSIDIRTAIGARKAWFRVIAFQTPIGYNLPELRSQ